MRTLRFLLLLGLIIAFVPNTQAQEVTRFLDIPVDGSKSAMIQQLLTKGFTKVPNSDEDVLTGEFNGQQVNLYINTNRDKVWRIMALNVTGTDAINIKKQFNRLLSQFAANDKYLPNLFQAPITDLIIPDDEDITYEMLVSNKQYEASFYQIPAGLEEDESFKNEIFQILSQKYSEKQLAKPSKKMQQDIILIIMEQLFQHCSNNVVWFKIVNILGDYHLAIYYDNCLNQANGEDL